MNIIFTRPLIDAEDLMTNFFSSNYKVIHLPTLSITSANMEPINAKEFDGLIFTSANALKNLDTAKIDKNIFCFCVGSATEKQAKESGFQKIFCADGNVNNLKELIIQNFDPNSVKLISVDAQNE